MYVSSQPPDLAALRPGNQPSVPMDWEAGWKLWTTKQFVAPGRESDGDFSGIQRLAYSL